MTARLSRLNELSAHLDTIELGRYDEDGDSRMLKDAAIGAGGIGAAGLGGLYLRNRGDTVNAARHAELLKAGAGKLKEGMEGPTVPAKFEDFRGSSWNAVKTGAADSTKGIKSKLAGLLSKLKITRGVPTIKASAKHERLVELSEELDGVVELGLKYGDKVGEMLKISAAKRANALGESTRKRMYINVGPDGSAWNTKDKGFDGMVTRILNDPDVTRVKGGMAYVLPPRRKQVAQERRYSSRHENLIALSSELDSAIELSLKPGRGARLISRLDELAHASGRKIDSKTLGFLQDHVRSNKMTGLMSRMKGYDAPRGMPDAGEALTDQLRSIAKTTPGLRALSAELDKVISLDAEDGFIGGATVAGLGAGAYGLHQRGAGIKISGREKREWMKRNHNVLTNPKATPQVMAQKFAKYAESPGVTRNISAGFGDLWKSGKSYLRAALK